MQQKAAERLEKAVTRPNKLLLLRRDETSNLVEREPPQPIFASKAVSGESAASGHREQPEKVAEP